MIRISCRQLAPRIADLEGNRDLTTHAIADAVAAGADVVVLPELATSGYAFASREEAASVAVDAGHPIFADWAAEAARGDALVVGGFCELGSDGALYNSAAVVDGSGVLAVYRKTHLWDGEKLVFEPGGDEPPVLGTPVGRIGVLICYDLEFPELTRALALRGADLIVVPANWPLVPRPAGERPPEVIAAMAAARANRVFVACCDRSGSERGQDWTAGSAVIDASGWVVATAAGDGVARADVDLLQARTKTLTEHSDALGDRRPELYAEVTRRLASPERERPAVPAGLPADVELRLIKAPRSAPSASRDPAVTARVSEMLLRIERQGMDAVRAYSRDLDGWDPDDFAVGEAEIAAAAASLPDELLEAIAFAQRQVRSFAEHQRAGLVDSEVETLPGVQLGQRQVPVARVGAYVPAGRVPMLATPFMTVLVAKVAGVERVVACSPPRDGRGIHPPVLHSIATSGADAIFALGGVQALAAMAFGIEEFGPVDMLVGPGNAFVAEAKRQLFGKVGIDLLAGPSEITVLADETADPELVAADLLGQAEHGPTSPAILVTTDEALADEVVREIERQLDELAELGADETPRRAWEDHGAAIVVGSHDDAVRVVDGLAPEHLEVHTGRDDWYFEQLRNYGSLFLGARATVAFSDKAIGTNHTLPTGQAARYTGGLSVAKFLKTLTYQRIVTDAGVEAIAPAVAEISRADLMPAHEATANRRLARLSRVSGA